MIRVYKYDLRPPTLNESLVRQQLEAARCYRNQLVAIERGRRWAVRQCEDTENVRAAIEVVRSATRSTRKEAIKSLAAARREAREAASSYAETPEVVSALRAMAAIAFVAVLSGLRPGKLDVARSKRLLREARAAAGDRLAAIALLDEEIRKNAYEHAATYWGTTLSINASADQVRRMGLYGDDSIEPSDPRFVRGDGVRQWPGGQWTGGSGQIGVQLQGGLATPDALAGQDTRVRLVDGVLWLRVGSEGRAPVWATWPMIRSRRGDHTPMHRAIPDNATWSWVRVALRSSGPVGDGRREHWYCTITVDIPGGPLRDLDMSIDGAIAIEATWDKPRERLIVARWRDSRGASGTIELPARIDDGIGKPDAIRSVRDQTLNELRPALARLIRESLDVKPRWLVDAGASLHLWKSPSRFYDLVRRWRGERCDAAREAYDRLQDWELRDAHLWAYETGGRNKALAARKDFYRNLAARWSREYKHVIVDDRRLDREARWGEESELRFRAGPSELRGALEHAFGTDCSTHPVREELSEEGDRDWCERAIDAWMAGGARKGKKANRVVHGKGGAWGSRTRTLSRPGAKSGGARNPAHKVAE